MEIEVKNREEARRLWKGLRATILEFGTFGLDDVAQFLGRRVEHPMLENPRWNTLKTASFYHYQDKSVMVLGLPVGEKPVQTVEGIIWTHEEEPKDGETSWTVDLEANDATSE